MSTAFGEFEPEPEPEFEPAHADLGAMQHVKLAPRAGPSVELPREEPASSSTDPPQQQQDQITPLQFTFINTTNDVQYSGPGSRGVARSHVMRNYHWRKGKTRRRQAKVNGPSDFQSLAAIAPVCGPLSSNRGSSRLDDIEDSELHKGDENFMRSLSHLEKEKGPGNNSAMWPRDPRGQGRPEDPSALPMSNPWVLPVDAHAAELIRHYIQTFARTFVPVKQTWESEWFKNALSDQACYHGTLFLSVAHKALLTETEDPLPMECFRHKGEAIRIINERLSDPVQRATDGTIAAIACLAAFETLRGTVTAATVHVDGLQKLVVMRGGPKQLGMDGFLEQLLYWVDLSNATATREKPHFLPFETSPVCPRDSDSEALWKYCDSQWNKEVLIDIPIKSYQGLDAVEARLFHRLRQLTHLASHPPSSSPTPAHQQSYSASVLLFERQVGLAVQEYLAFGRRFGPTAFHAPTCLFYIPALIICYLILRPVPAQASIYGPLVVRMKRHIDHLAPSQVFDRFAPQFWFWGLLFVGAAAMGRPQQAYFQRVMAQLCGVLGVRSWEGAKDVLRGFVWEDAVCERPCRPFWDAVERMEVVRVEGDIDIVGCIQLQDLP